MRSLTTTDTARLIHYATKMFQFAIHNIRFTVENGTFKATLRHHFGI